MGADELRAVRSRIADAAARSGRRADSVTLVAVSKGRSDVEVAELYEAGQRDFGENRSDELEHRLTAGLAPDIRWHFVGSLQRRKVPAVAGRVALLHSVDRVELAEAWLRSGGGPALLQVNVSAEPQKHGFPVDDVVTVATRLAGLGLDLRGLMAIPRLPRRPDDSRPAFETMRALGGELARQLPTATELSMGMTDDFEVAVECGATIVRVGRAIFDRPAGSGPPAGGADQQERRG